MLSWNMLFRHLASSGRKETQWAWNQVMNFDSRSWLRNTALCRGILHCYLFLIKRGERWSSENLQSFSSDRYSRDLLWRLSSSKPRKYLTFICKINHKDDHRGTQLHFTGGKAKVIRTPHHPGVWGRTETRPELLAPSLGLYNSFNSSSPWKLRPIPWKIILFSPVFSRLEPA